QAAFFRHLVEEAADGVWVIDADSRTTYMNTRMAGMLGGEARALHGAPIWQFMDQDARAAAEHNVDRRRAGVRETHEFRFRRLDGSHFWAEVSTSPMFDAQGNYTGAFAYVLDIEQRKATELALADSERAYREVFDRSHAVKLVIAPDNGQIVAANAAARNYYGYDAETFARLSIHDINTLSEAEVQAEMVRAKQEERAYFLFRHRLASGEVRDVEVHATPITTGGRTLIHSIVHDIGRQTEAERQLRFTLYTVEQAHISIAWVQPDGSLRDVNAYATRMLDYPREALLGRPVWDFDTQFDAADWPALWESIKTEGARTFRAEIRNRSGQLVPIEVYATFLSFDGEECIVAYARHISEQVRSERLLALQNDTLAAITAGHPLPHVLTQLAERVEQLAPEIQCSILLLDGQRVRHGAAPSLPPAFVAAINGAHIGPQAGSCGTAAYLNQPVEVADIATDPLWADYRSLALPHGLRACWSCPIRASDGSVLGTFAIYYQEPRHPSPFHRRIVEACTDLAGIAIEHRRAEDRIHTLAFYDPLTGLPNRALFQDRAELAIAHAHRNQLGLALLFTDLDRFKTINDSLGHAVGDKLLQVVARRLEAGVRDSDTVCRLGGDEFVLLLPDCDAAGALGVAEKLIASAAEPVSIDGHDLNGTASIGIALFPQDGNSYDSLLKHADAAMYRAKELGRNAFCFYRQDMNAEAAERLELENALHQALARQELCLYYQPQVRIANRSLYGLEALLRWQHPQWGMVSPARFIPVAEECGLIDSIGRWVLDEACRQFSAWQAQGIAPPRISVNLSARQFQHDDIPAMVDATLARHGMSASQLTLEITESLMMVRDDSTLGALRQLDQMGVTLAVDDFGTGYSSLGYLKRYPVRELKLDQSFVRDLDADADDRALASAVIHIGQSLRLTVVAEGVETASQLAFLREQGCQVAQGYHYARPMPADTLDEWLRLPLVAPEESV
ncbi:sensor domain-containing protein, partial [Chitinimonas sp.]|uniref:sensor domain-containing protein n=1 Tax=Chitinimonas sp. TaxID=1934313 RepID=UPI002F91DB8C